MKNLIYIITILSLFCACDSNEQKSFDRGDANVYFPVNKMGVTVGNTLSIPVTLANLPGGQPVTIGISIQDSTAQEGVDYILRSGRTCIFEKGHGTEFIVIEAIEKASDSVARRILTVTLDPTEGLRANSRNQITVELRNYSSHPLRKFLGDAVFSGYDLIQKAQIEFPINIYPDDENEQILYVSGVTGGVYAGILSDLTLSVDTNKHEILIQPKVFVNRKLGGVSGDVELVKGTLKGSSVGITGGVPIRCTYNNDGSILFDDWFGAVWKTGSDVEKALFLYYGLYEGKYRTAILRKE